MSVPSFFDREGISSLDLVINNSGKTGTALKIEELSFESLSLAMNVHCLGAGRVIQACLPILENPDGSMIIKELQQKGIRICSVHPGRLISRERSADADMSIEEAVNRFFTWSTEAWSRTIQPEGNFLEPYSEPLPW